MFSSSPRSTGSPVATGKTHEQHNIAKHPHAVQGEHRAKHQAQKNPGTPNSRHLLPEAKAMLQVIGSIRPPCVPKPKVEVMLPSREPQPDFITYSPFDLRFPPYATSRPASRTSSPKASSAMSSPQRTATAVALMKAANETDKVKSKISANVKNTNIRNLKKKPMTQVAQQKNKVVKSSNKIDNKRLHKQHEHDVPRKIASKNWHLAGWVTYSPFDTNFDKVCNGNKARMSPAHHHPHAHHVAGQPHHPGHHQAHHVQHSVSPAQKTIADFYANSSNLMAFPRMSPTAGINGNGMANTAAPAPVGMTSFFMPMPQIGMPTVNMPTVNMPTVNMPTVSMSSVNVNSSMNTLPGSMRAYAPTTGNMPFSSGFAW